MFLRIAPIAAAVLLAAPAVAGGFTPTVATPAPAAPVVVTPSPAATPTADWSGFYAGGQLGYGSVAVDDNDDVVNTVIDEDDHTGALYGLHAGYMRDLGRFVLGAEVDFDGTQITIDDTDATTGEAFEAADVGSVVRGKVRLGFDAGRVLPYLTAGVAQVRLNSDVDDIDELLESSYRGQFVGVGAAYQLNDRLMVGAEVLRHSFDDAPLEGWDSDVTTATLRGSIRF